ncbi:DNA gyrase subunit A [soil metagenome]
MAKQRDRVVLRHIEDEMKQSFLDYSMSVIVQRALPDVRDGLKPVHRRILYSMHESGLSPTRPFKKSATVVGDVLGKYHPHGDTAVYDALVRMVQDFSLRYPLVDGQGNFGSIDGDSAAAYRYTESRLSTIATLMLADIDRDTVDYSPNFDDRLMEPRVLPSKLPNLLVNGSSGIAVGMSTNIPPHNIREITSAAIYLLDFPDCSVADLMEIVPGPDFPTGGLIVGMEGIRKAYETGRGRVIMRARIGKETKRGGREQLVITEIPYATNKTRIIEQIVDLAKRGKIADIADLRDESDRDGIRMVIELKRGADADRAVRALLKWTALQSTFGVISLALDNGVPREFTLKEMLERFRDHRVQVVIRRSRWELGKAEEEAHVLRGLLIALKNIDEVVRIIRGSRTRETAGEKLKTQFKLTDRQAEAILLMRLYRLTQLEGKDLRDRLRELEVRIAELEAILASPERQLAAIRSELEEIRETFGDKRRTQIIETDQTAVLEQLVAQEDVVVTLSHEGFIQQIPMYLYRRRLSAGRALAAMERYESDFLEHVFVASTADTLMFISTDGQAYWLPVSEIPEASRSSRGKALFQLLELPRQQPIAAMLPLGRQQEDAVLIFMTEQGVVKRTSLSQFASQRGGGVNAIGLREGDRLLDVQVSDGNADILLVSREGRLIRFPESHVAEVGRTAQGVRGIKLSGSGDRVVGAVVVRREGALCTVTEKGLVHRMPVAEISVQRRDGLGSAVYPLGAKTGKLVAAKELLAGDDLIVIVSDGQTVRLAGDSIPIRGRGEPGEPLLRVKRGEKINEVVRVSARDPARSVTSAASDSAPEEVEMEEDFAAIKGGDEISGLDDDLATMSVDSAERETGDTADSRAIDDESTQFDLLG